MSELSSFDGREVIRATVAITNAGDGLSQALAIEPREYHLNDTVYVVLECAVSKVRFEPSDKDDPDHLVRVHTFRAGTATIVESKAVAKALADQRKAIARAKGLEELPGMDVD